MAATWCQIESDPGVFTELIRNFGVKGVQVEELWSLDLENYINLKPIHGLIFLFKYKSEDVEEGSIVRDDRMEKIFFAKQVINNACATQAILSILMNLSNTDVAIGDTLQSFKDFVLMFDPSVKGLAISNSEVIRTVHNSFARQQMFEFDESFASKDDEAYHFISYMPIEGRLYELDGLKEGPIDHGKIPEGSDWMDTARPIIQKRIQRYSADEVHFNLMAVISDRHQWCQRRIEDITSLIGEGGMETEDLHSELNKLQIMLKEEENKLHRYKVENIRRRHNYLPFIMELLKVLAKNNLSGLVEKAKERAAGRSQAKITNETITKAN